MVGIITLAPGADPQQPDRGARRLRDQAPPQGRRGDDRRHAPGFVIGITSAGSGTVIAILLIAIFRLDAAEGRRHRRLPRRDPALGGRRRPTGSAATSTSSSPATSCSARSPGSSSAPTSPPARRPASCAPRSASSWSPRGSSPCRRATRSSGRCRRASPGSASALIYAPRWYQKRPLKAGCGAGRDLRPRPETAPDGRVPASPRRAASRRSTSR